MNEHHLAVAGKQMSEWIKFKADWAEFQPKDSESGLTFLILINGELRFAKWECRLGAWDYYIRGWVIPKYYGPVSHWMPLPPPPEATNE